MRLDDREWKDFGVPEIFQNIKRGKRLKNADHIPGIVPYVSSTANNNGVDDHIEISPGARTFKNCISLANSGSVGSAFYEPFEFVASDHVTSLECKEANVYIYLFLTAVLEQQSSNFNFNREINDIRIKKMRVMLPVTDEGKPDFLFMENYIRELMGAKRKQYIEFVEKRLKSLELEISNEGGYSEELKSREWGEFFLEDLFTVSSGKRLTNADKTDGDRPFIGATDNNNGITGFVDNKNNSLDMNVLGVNYNGAPCIGFYHPYECIFTDDVKRLHLKNHEDNPYILLFMKAVILQQRTKYSYGYKFNENRMLRQLLMVPVNDNGQPDYQLMEEYGKKLMSNKYSQYLEFLQNNQHMEIKRGGKI